MSIDLTPSAIARKLTPEGTASEVVAVVEAMAERALREIGPQAHAAGAMIKVERLMTIAADAVRQQRDVRVARVFKAIREWTEDNMKSDLGAIDE
ncbi:MAG TPA: hypothetical protein VLN57_21315 [Xanthobacteraceae bacterium]|nr:hypothetical protein [Xanthobacteraceae bacterium]